VLASLPPPAVAVGSLVEQYGEWAVRSAVFVGVLAVAYLLGRLLVVPPVARAVRARNPDDPTLVDAVELYLRIAFVVVGLPVAVAAAGFGGVVAGSALVVAAATLALGVAGQDVVGNLVSGVFLVADPEFRVGDFVAWGDASGTVERIGLRVTRVRTPDNEGLTVPNTDLATTTVRRPYARERHRINERLVVGYDADLDATRALLVAAAEETDRVLAEPPPVVHVTGLGGSAVELVARLWLDPGDDAAAVRTEFDTRAVERLREAGVTVAPAAATDLSGRLSVAVEGD
jgi:small-conductance mechanosensitive channel